MADNNITNTEATNPAENTEVIAPAEPASEESSSVITYTEEEVASKVSKAVNAALDKYKKNSQKSNEEVANELAELKAQLNQERNQAYVANEINTRGIPSVLTELFYADDSDLSKAKLDVFSKWYKGAIDEAVETRLNATKAPQFNVSDPEVKGPNRRRSLKEIQNGLPKPKL